MVILLDNALKYIEAGDTITVDSHTSKRHWYIYVKNTGSNIADEDKDRIFGRFYRDSTSRADETSGYGLGLAIAKQIIEDHQGTYTVEMVILTASFLPFVCAKTTISKSKPGNPAYRNNYQNFQ